MTELSFEVYEDAIRSARTVTFGGIVRDVVGLLVESSGPKVKMGEICYLLPASGVRIL